MPAYSKRQKTYPSILRSKPRPRKTVQGKLAHKSLRLRFHERQALLDAIWEHFGLTAGDWQGLAICLLERHVPAFKKEHRGRAKLDITEQEWAEFWALDKRHWYGDGVLEFVQARFVKCVNDAAEAKGKEAAFRLLAKEPHRLPSRYRNRTTPQSLKQAYRQVPQYIRDCPEQCIPGTPQYEAAQIIKAET